MSKRPLGILLDSPGWLLSSERKGRKFLAPSPESTPAHDRFLARTPLLLLGTPQPLMLSAGFCLFPSIFQLPRESPSRKSPVAIPGVPLTVPEACFRRQLLFPSSCSLSSAPLFSRAGRELAGLWLPRQSCGCGCLQCPLVTCSRCSHNMRGVGDTYCRVTPFLFFFPIFTLTSGGGPLPQTVQQPLSCVAQPLGTKLVLEASDFLHLHSDISSYAGFTFSSPSRFYAVKYRSGC